MKGELRDGWFEAEGVKGFERFTVRVRAEVINGQIRATALQIAPHSPEGVQGLTARRLATLPLQELANVAVNASDFRRQPSLNRDLARLTGSSAKGGKQDPRRQTTPEAVAQEWLIAYHQGKPPRQAVCTALRISERTADNYIREALELDLIPAQYMRRGRARTSNPSAPTRRPYNEEERQ